MKIDPNHSAFPNPSNGMSMPDYGLTIRAHFAAMAMQGLCANPKFFDAPSSQIAAAAVLQADALIKALSAEANK